MYYNELYHHGRLGQRWGERNGPPYPLSRSTVQREYSGKKSRGLSGYIQEQRRKKEEKKSVKAAKEAASRKEAEEKEKARHEADKERVLREGTATEVLQYKNELTNQELSSALNRIKWRNELTKLSKEETENGWKTIDQVMKKVGDVKDWSKIGIELWKNIDEAQKMMDKHNKKGS